MATYKLVSPKGTLLGTITVPDPVARYLDEDGFAEGALIEAPRVYVKFDGPVTMAAFRRVIFREAYEFHGAVQMFGVTPEEIEKYPGYSFSPGAGYLRSLLAT